MKTAKLHIRVLEFTCPHCDEYIASETGSHMFPIEDPLPETIECDACGKTSKVPKLAHRLQAS